MTLERLFGLPEAEIVRLVDELDVRGPRYTSYPTAPVWKATDLRADYQEAVRRVASDGRPVAVYLHLPFCKSRCLYCGCNSFVVNVEETICQYVDTLEREIRTAAAYVDVPLRHAWLHLGGGTPTHVPHDRLARLLDTVLEAIPGAEGAERSVEVDPRVTSDDHLRVLAERGFRRISVGLQDFEPEVQRTIHRVFSVEQMHEFIDRARGFGFTSVNVDLIYGLPRQTRSSWRRTLDHVAALRPDRLASFGYAHLPARIKHQRALPGDELPTPHERLGMLLDANLAFVEAGYAVIGMDHFAAPGDALADAVESGGLWRNFMGYTEIRGLEMLGFGASSIGELHEMFVQNTVLPEGYNKQVALSGWAAARGHRLDEDDRLRKALINELMCNLVVRMPDGADAVPGLQDELGAAMTALEPYLGHGLIEALPAGEGPGYRVTELGRLFLRNLAMPFDRYLPDQQGVTFSKTV